MKTVKATVVYPVYGVEVEVEDNATPKFITEALFNKADDYLQSSGIQPLITFCTDESLVDDEGI